MVRRTLDDAARLRDVVLCAWAAAVCVAGRRVAELPPVQGYQVVPRCTRHFRGCGCAGGTVRLYATNHHQHSASRSFDAIRRALGAVPWQEGGDVEVLR